MREKKDQGKMKKNNIEDQRYKKGKEKGLIQEHEEFLFPPAKTKETITLTEQIMDKMGYKPASNLNRILGNIVTSKLPMQIKEEQFTQMDDSSEEQIAPLT